jgi:hypothetical protein
MRVDPSPCLIHIRGITLLDKNNARNNCTISKLIGVQITHVSILLTDTGRNVLTFQINIRNAFYPRRSHKQ